MEFSLLLKEIVSLFLEYFLEKTGICKCFLCHLHIYQNICKSFKQLNKPFVKSTSNKCWRGCGENRTLTLLVGMQTSTVAMENSVEIP